MVMRKKEASGKGMAMRRREGKRGKINRGELRAVVMESRWEHRKRKGNDSV